MIALYIVIAVMAGLAMLLLLPLAIWLLAVALVVLAFVFWIWMLVEAIQNKGLSDGEKVGWVLAIVFLHFIGAVLYYFIGHPKRMTPRPGM